MNLYFLSNLPANVAAILLSILSLYIEREKFYIKRSLELMIISLAALPILAEMLTQ